MDNGSIADYKTKDKDQLTIQLTKIQVYYAKKTSKNV